MKRNELELSGEDRAALMEIVKKSRDWRMRDRSQTVLYFADGWPAKAISEKQELDLDTVYKRRKSWLEDGISSLPDKYRKGAPSKLSEHHREQIKAWALAEALTAPALLAKLKEEFEVSVHVNTLSAALKKMGLVWMRTRHSLKKTG